MAGERVSSLSTSSLDDPCRHHLPSPQNTPRESLSTLSETTTGSCIEDNAAWGMHILYPWAWNGSQCSLFSGWQRRTECLASMDLGCSQRVTGSQSCSRNAPVGTVLQTDDNLSQRAERLFKACSGHR